MNKRGYVMRARADAKAETRQRIIAAVHDLAQETLNLHPTLEVVAARAGVSVQTLLRHFGSRDGLLDAATESVTTDVMAERATPVGDVDAAVRTIVEHYERRGDFVVHLLGHETQDARIATIVTAGRAMHRAWVSEVFGPLLPAGRRRAELVDLLVVATDVYTWKLLRRDRGLSRNATESRVHRLIEGLLPGGAP